MQEKSPDCLSCLADATVAPTPIELHKIPDVKMFAEHLSERFVS